MDSLVIIALIGITIMLVLLLMGTNIGMTFFIVGFLGFLCVTKNFSGAFGLLKTVPFTTALSYNQSVLIMFTIMGQIAFEAGISSGLYEAADKWLSRFRGGLSMATIAACAGFAAICGSSSATTATMGTVALPEMKKYRYADSLATGCIAAGGTLGILIPPSSIFIIYGILTEQSIGRLFAAGIVPGIVLALCYVASTAIQVKINPSLAQKSPPSTWREKIISTKGCIPVIILFGVVMGGMFLGLFTANEAAGVGVFLSTLFMITNRKFSLKKYVDALKNGMKTAAMVILTLTGCNVFGYFLSVTQLPAKLAVFLGNLDIHRYQIILILLVFYIVMGCIMDSLPVVCLTVPIFLPFLQSLGFNPIWYGVFMVMVCEMGTITPPVGMNAYVVAGVAKGVPLQQVFKGVLPYCLSLLVAILLVIIFPQMATGLPEILYGSL
jgi:tripartite ATP-independent transporter DctM subunit